MSGQTSLDRKNILKYFLFVFLIVHAELFVTTRIIFGQTLPGYTGNISILFSLILLSLFLIKNDVFLRNKPRIFYLLVNLMVILLFVFSYFQLSSIAGIRQQILTSGYPALRLRFLFVFLIAPCYCTLFSMFFSGRNLAYKYLFSLALCLLLARLYTKYYLISKIWVIISYGVGRIVFLLLKISGLNPVFFYDSKTVMVGTGLFNVKIIYPCAGVEGIVSFLIAFTVMVIFSWKRIDKTKALAVAYIGVFLMYVLNILRICILILIGHFLNQGLALELFHTQGGLILYALAIILILVKAKKWITQ